MHEMMTEAAESQTRCDFLCLDLFQAAICKQMHIFLTKTTCLHQRGSAQVWTLTVTLLTVEDFCSLSPSILQSI